MAAQLRLEESFEFIDSCDSREVHYVSLSSGVAACDIRHPKSSHSTCVRSGTPVRFRASGIIFRNGDANSKPVSRWTLSSCQLACLTMVTTGAPDSGKSQRWLNVAAALGSQTRALMKQVPLLERAGKMT